MIELMFGIVGVCVILFLLVLLLVREHRWKDKVEFARQDAIKRSRATIEGKVYEQLVPHLPGWEFDPSDARFLGSPIDFVVFDGLSKNRVERVVIVEIKKGKSKTTARQNSIKKAIKAGNFEWKLITVEDDGSKID